MHRNRGGKNGRKLLEQPDSKGNAPEQLDINLATCTAPQSWPYKKG